MTIYKKNYLISNKYYQPVIISPSRIVIDEIIAQEASSGLNKKIVKFVLFQDSLLMASRIIPTKKSALPNSKSNLEDGFRFDMLIRHDNLFIMENQGIFFHFFFFFVFQLSKFYNHLN